MFRLGGPTWLGMVVAAALVPPPLGLGPVTSGIIQDWDKKGNIEGKAWSQTPDGRYYVDSTVVAPDETFTYKYVDACSGIDRTKAVMCGIDTPACKAGEDGRLVDWYRSLKAPNPIQWELLSASTCIYSEKPIDVLAEIAARINSEFKKTPVKGATVASQPGPHTLRGSFNNFYANANTQDFDITLLGQKVHITATPVSYTWNYGDGQTMGPTDLAGAPLPEDRIGEQTLTSHAYQATGTYSITATTHFNGSYSVNGGPTLPIPEQGHIGSPPITVKVWRAVTKNYADNCLANPQGAGC